MNHTSVDILCHNFLFYLNENCITRAIYVNGFVNGLILETQKPVRDLKYNLEHCRQVLTSFSLDV